jgi:hypothetical protein
VLQRFNRPSEAHLARSLLESEGIPVWLGDEHINEVNPLLGPAVGWVRLRVPAELVTEARQLLAQDASAALEGVVRSAPESFTRTTAVGDGGPRRAPRGSQPLWLWLLWVVMLVIAARIALWQGE